MATRSATAAALPEPAPRKKRRPYRREQILESAVELFQRNGYHATGMDEIGATAGITGPAIYRHFKNKEDILETLLMEMSEQTLAAAQALVLEAATPAQALRSLVEFSADALLENPPLAYVAQYERRTLPPKSRAALDKVERQYFEAWLKPLCEVRPDLSEAEARVIVHAAVGMATAATTYKADIDRETAHRLVVAMMMNALLVPRRALTRPRRPRTD